MILLGERIAMFRCQTCQDLHVQIACVGGALEISAVQNAKDWAELFLKDPEFEFEVRELLKERERTK